MVENRAAFFALLPVLHAARLFGCSGMKLFFAGGQPGLQALRQATLDATFLIAAYARDAQARGLKRFESRLQPDFWGWIAISLRSTRSASRRRGEFGL